MKKSEFYLRPCPRMERPGESHLYMVCDENGKGLDVYVLRSTARNIFGKLPPLLDCVDECPNCGHYMSGYSSVKKEARSL